MEIFGKAGPGGGVAGAVVAQMRIGRGERIRTSGPCLPKAVLYQAELLPDGGRYPAPERGGRRAKPRSCSRAVDTLQAQSRWRGTGPLAIDLVVYPLQILATLLGVVTIVLLIRRNIWNFPVGLVTVALYARIFTVAQLYSEALLQLVFLALQAYGWWCWTRAGAGEDGGVRVGRMAPRQRIGWAAAALVLSLAGGAAMARLTTVAHPWWDATIAVLSVIAQLLLAWRYREAWMLWILVDLLAVVLYWRIGLYPAAGLYGLFLILAGWGLVAWNGSARRTARMDCRPGLG